MDRQHSAANRRTFLKTTGALATVGVAGCLGGNDDDTGGNQDDTPTATATEAEDGGSDSDTDSGGSQDDQLEDTLNVFQWGDYWPDGFVQGFEEEVGVSVNVSNYSSNEEMFNKLKAGGTGQFDLIFPSDYMVNILQDQGMIQPLNVDSLENWGNLSEKFQQAPYDPGDERYSAPFQWGTSGIGWNAEMIGDDVEISSWEAMWNEEWAGQMTVLDDMRETIGMALKYLGYSLNTTNESEINEAKELLIEQKDLLKAYDSDDFQTNLINQAASPVHAWSGGIFAAYWELWAEGEGSPINYVIPDEGGVVWVDTAAVTSEAKSPNAAHAFIDYFLDAENGAEVTNYTYYGSPNEAAEEYIYEEILEDEKIYPNDETMSQLEFIENVGQATQIYSQAWTEIKNA